MKITCSNCGKYLEAPDEAAGKRGRCPYCKIIIEVLEKKKCIHCLRQVDKNTAVCEFCGSNIKEYDIKQDFLLLAILLLVGIGAFIFMPWLVISGLVVVGIVCFLRGQTCTRITKNKLISTVEKPDGQGSAKRGFLNCLYCNKQISSFAKICPHCGHKTCIKEAKAQRSEGEIKMRCPECGGILIGSESEINKTERCPLCGELYKTVE